MPIGITSVLTLKHSSIADIKRGKRKLSKPSGYRYFMAIISMRFLFCHTVGDLFGYSTNPFITMRVAMQVSALPMHIPDILIE